MVLATIMFAQGDRVACLKHMARITAQLRPLLSSYYDYLHDGKIPRSIWLSYIQGFFAWGIGQIDEISKEWVKFDGLSGNQVLLFQALDGFLGFEPYLSPRDQERNVPARQRALCKAFKKHSFRKLLSDVPRDEAEAKISEEFNEIVKRLRVSLYHMSWDNNIRGLFYYCRYFEPHTGIAPKYTCPNLPPKGCP